MSSHDICEIETLCSHKLKKNIRSLNNVGTFFKEETNVVLKSYKEKYKTTFGVDITFKASPKASLSRDNIVESAKEEHRDFPPLLVDNAFIHFENEQQIGIIKTLGEIMVEQKCENSVECGVGGGAGYSRGMLGFFLEDITQKVKLHHKSSVSEADLILGEILREVENAKSAGEAFFSMMHRKNAFSWPDNEFVKFDGTWMGMSQYIKLIMYGLNYKQFFNDTWWNKYKAKLMNEGGNEKKRESRFHKMKRRVYHFFKKKDEDFTELRDARGGARGSKSKKRKRKSKKRKRKSKKRKHKSKRRKSRKMKKRKRRKTRK